MCVFVQYTQQCIFEMVCNHKISILKILELITRLQSEANRASLVYRAMCEVLTLCPSNTSTLVSLRKLIPKNTYQCKSVTM